MKACVNGYRHALVVCALLLLSINAQAYAGGQSSEQLLLSGGTMDMVTIHPKREAGSRDTFERKGVLVRYKDARATILVCHGFMCDKYDVGMLRSIFGHGKYNVMTFDFRAHGESVDGQCCTFGKNEALDVRAAAKFLRNHPDLKDKPLFVYGFSMGAAASIEAQSQKKLFDAMVLDCPFDSVENVIKRGLSRMKISLFGYEIDMPGRSFLQEYAFHPYVQSLVKMALKTVANLDPRHIETDMCPCTPALSAKNISVPCFFIHCRNDQKVPLEAGKAVFEAVGGPKKMWITNGRRHFDSYFYNPERYAYNIQEFFDQAIAGFEHAALAGEVVEDVDDLIDHKVVRETR